MDKNVLTDDNLKKSLKGAISHEMIHAIDPKKGKDKNPDDFISPSEFDAYGSQIEIELKTKLADKSIPIEKRKEKLKTYKNWLQTGKGIPPNFLFDIWKKNPYLWRKFRQKLYTTITDIEQELKRDVR